MDIRWPSIRRVGLGLLACGSLLAKATPAADNELPDGPGKTELVMICTTCHGTDPILRARYTRDQWSETVLRMKNRGAEGGPDELDLIADYLFQHFGKSDKVNVNKADTGDLIAGLALTMKDAQAITAYRKEHGDFKNLQDLQKVEGVDLKKIESAKDKIEF